MNNTDLQRFLDKKVQEYQTASFIPEDPVAIPHRYSRLQDIEIAGFFAALFAWGRRSLILKKSAALLELMDDAPYDFVLGHQQSDLKRFFSFVHRTFNATDILFFIAFLRKLYLQHSSLEFAFAQNIRKDEQSVENALNGFHKFLFQGDYPQRTTKHISAPFRRSACKRLNMFLRWMVRKDTQGVDFGIWKSIRPDQLVIPMDIHVSRVAGRLQLIPPGQAPDWRTAATLTAALKKYDPEDPVKYDFALFGLGVIEKFN